jgi:hypothetical protein
MVLSELLIDLKKLNRSDKLYVIQVLVSELSQKEANLTKSDQIYPVWSPYDAFDAADVLLKVLNSNIKNENL